MQEKSIISLIEERFQQVNSRIDQEKILRQQDNENIMKRLKSLTEELAIVRHSVETISQELASHSSQVSSITGSINNFVNQTKQDRKVLQDALTSDL